MEDFPTLDRKSIEALIIVIRGKAVLLDSDLAALFGTETKKLNQQVKRNIARFDDQFAFQLTAAEFARLKSQDVTASGHGGRRTPPWAFTEHGVAMAATVLTSPRAIEALKLIIEVFVASRRQMTSGAAARPEDVAQRTRRELQLVDAQRVSRDKDSRDRSDLVVNQIEVEMAVPAAEMRDVALSASPRAKPPFTPLRKTSKSYISCSYPPLGSRLARLSGATAETLGLFHFLSFSSMDPYR